jgi:hypothetical protein
MIYLYSQGSESVGLGHLNRTIRLSELFAASNLPHKLLFNLDPYAKTWVENKTKKYLSVYDVEIKNLDAVVIDAICIDKYTRQLFCNASKRVVISPVFNAFDIATHVLVRELSEDVRLSIPASAEVIQEESFAFITSVIRENDKLNYSSINIGICLSGGKQDFPYECFFNSIEKISGIDSITVVGQIEQVKSNITVNVIPIQENTVLLWRKLENINIFIGRQGLMVSEALAQGIPVISLKEVGESQKNNAAIKSEMVMSCEISMNGFKRLHDFLRNKKNLQKAHNKIVDYVKDKAKSDLFEAITKVLG